MKFLPLSSKIWVVCYSASALSISQDYHNYHPIEKSNYYLRKGIILNQNRIDIEHVLETKWVDIADHIDSEI